MTETVRLTRAAAQADSDPDTLRATAVYGAAAWCHRQGSR
jgi:hypothetical protein